MKRLAVLALVVGCVDGELGALESEVIGGQPTVAGKFPGVGALMYTGPEGPLAGCTGTLIAPDAVLTAAHCVDPALTGDEVPGFSLALDTTVGGIAIVPGREKIKHERFELTNPFDGLGEFFDVGILLLAEPVTEVAPVPMPRPTDQLQIQAGLALEIVGYGRTSTASDATGVLFDAQTELISLNDTEIQVGMGSPQPQNCNGDSGGPGFANIGARRRVIGIVSRSFSGFECNQGGIDTRVDAYLDWIHEKVVTGIPCGSGMSEPCADDGDDGDEAGCCSTSRRGLPGSCVLALGVAMVLLRRRRVR